MHILLIHQAFAALDEPGGTRHHELARFLVKRGHRVTVIASPVSYLTGRARAGAEKTTSDPDLAGVTIVRTYTYSALHRSFVHRVFSFFSFMASSFWAGVRVREVDLVWGTSPPIFQGMTAWALARLKRKPLLFEVRDLWPDFAIQVGVLRNPLLIRLSRWLERFLYRGADQLIVNSPGFLEHVQKQGGSGVRVIPNGVDPAMFDPHAEGLELRNAHGLAGKFIVMYAGAHGMSNDLGIVLDAAQMLQDQPDISIVLVGDGKEKPALIARAEALGLRNVVFLPPVAKAGMGETLAAADACLAILKPVPMYATVYPNKVFDYMAAGRPVLLAIDGVIRGVVEQAGCGIFIPPGDPVELAAAVRRLAADRALAREMGQRGRRCVEQKFDRASLAEDLAELMEGMR
ncbi:MAG: glycosyltransferase family 4 protein [Anaerolineales bacterium]|nr:glycosyltransferase family 4 protein [Anaerolineales bacterium]